MNDALMKHLHELRPHDLLWIADAAGLSAPGAFPAWWTPELSARTPVVVRRERVGDPDLIAVGLRGSTRSERFAAYLSRSAIASCMQPEMLTPDVFESQTVFKDLPPLRALTALALQLHASGLRWGPTGSVGFALASGLPVLRADSDLDLVVRAPEPLSAAQTRLLLQLGKSACCRVDMQIDTGRGAFALLEWAAGRRQVMLKTDTGPLLTDDPWSLPGAH